jgi:DNA-binding NarL/FixJ family response regulator
VALSDGPSNHDQLIEVLRGLQSSYPNLRLILVLDSYDRSLVVSAMRAGARGLFCRASQPFRALCRCITVVHQGQFWANTEQIGYVVEALTLNYSPRVVNAKGVGVLTPREEQVVNLVVEGISNREMAQQLDIKENTVKKALQRIYDKLGVSNRVELVLYVLTHRTTEKGNSVPAERLTSSSDSEEPQPASTLGRHCVPNRMSAESRRDQEKAETVRAFAWASSAGQNHNPIS